MSSNQPGRVFGGSFFPQLIDYAGLFPPAALSLKNALDNYLHYREGRYAWALGRFICTAAHYKELENSPVTAPVPVSLVVKEPNSDLLKGSFGSREHQQRFPIESVETLLPQGVKGENALYEQLQIHGEVLGQIGENVTVFYELTPQRDAKPTWEVALWRDEATRLFNSIQRCGDGRSRGLKIRCGGVQDSMIPPVEVLSQLLLEVPAANVPIKFTAGLHAPFRHVPGPGDVGVTADMHGYFNVFFAAFVANSIKVSSSDLEKILLNREAPRVTSEGVRCLDWELPLSAIIELRSKKVLSFGSCSFLEPLKYGVELGWLE